MWAKSVSNVLGIGIFSSCILAATIPAQAQIVIQNGSLSGNLNYSYDQPLVPTYVLTGVDVNSLILETNIGTISNFEGAGQLTKVSNLAGVSANGKATIGTSASLSGLITGRSQTADGNFLVFNNTPITINGVVSSGRDVNEFTQTGTISITGGKIDANAPTTVTQPSSPNFGTSQVTGGVTLSPIGTLTNQFSASQLGFNPDVIQTLTNSPKDYVRVGSAELTKIPGPPSRIHPGLTAPR